MLIYKDRKLGIKIPPDQIRLPSRPSDPYVWLYHSSKEHLFSTPLSRGTISIYDEICNELDHCIEVVHREAHQTVQNAADLTSSDDSFVAQIHRLDDERQHLEKELQAARDTINDIREEKENLMLLLDKSTQQAIQWKSVAKRYQDFAMAINKLLENLNGNICCSNDSIYMENLHGPLEGFLQGDASPSQESC